MCKNVSSGLWHTLIGVKTGLLLHLAGSLYKKLFCMYKQCHLYLSIFSVSDEGEELYDLTLYRKS